MRQMTERFALVNHLIMKVVGLISPRTRCDTDIEPTQPPSVADRGVRHSHVMLETHSAEVHAERLLNVLQSSGLVDVILTHNEICPRYEEMCCELGWRPYPWNRVAACFRNLTTRRKVYEVREVNGKLRRVRIYPLTPM